MTRPLLALSVFFLLAMGGLPRSQADERPAPQALPANLSIEAPAGWDLLPGLSNKLARTAEQTPHLGEEAATSGALAYGRANRGALYLTWVDSVRALPSPEASIRAAFDSLHEAPYLASPEAGSTQEVSYRERNFDGVAEMSFEWAHMSNSTVNILRSLGYKDARGRVHLVIAECVLPSEKVSESRPLCEAALASLHLSAALERAPVGSLAAPRSPDELDPGDLTVPELETGNLSTGSTPASSPSLNAAPSKMGEVIYDGRRPSKEDKSNRLLIGIGVLLLAAAFWLTTRSRSGDKEKPADGGEDNEEEKAG